jgi:hypothetical protein
MSIIDQNNFVWNQYKFLYPKKMRDPGFDEQTSSVHPAPFGPIWDDINHCPSSMIIQQRILQDEGAKPHNHIEFFIDLAGVAVQIAGLIFEPYSTFPDGYPQDGDPREQNNCPLG